MFSQKTCPFYLKVFLKSLTSISAGHKEKPGTPLGPGDHGALLPEARLGGSDGQEVRLGVGSEIPDPTAIQVPLPLLTWAS